MALAVMQKSLAGGELSPTLYARVDVEKYGSAVGKARNWYVDYRGGLSTRMGTAFVRACKAGTIGQPRLIPFIVSATIAYELILGDFYMWFAAHGAVLVDGGGNPIEVATPYAAADIAALKYAQSADVLTFTHPSYPPYNLTRTDPSSFSLDQETIGPPIEPPTSPTLTAVNGSGTGSKFLYVYVFTAIDSSGNESLSTFPIAVDNYILDQTKGIINKAIWSPSPEAAASYNVYKSGPFPDSTDFIMPTEFGFIGSSTGGALSFTDNNIAPDFGHQPPQYQDPFSPGQIAGVTVATPGTGYSDSINILSTVGGGGTSFQGYTINDDVAGTVIGTVIVTPGVGFDSSVGIVDDGGLGGNEATYTVTLGQTTGTYPAVVGYFQQRRAFGATTNLPSGMVFSQTGRFNNFDVSPIVEDTDAITISLASLQVNAIVALTPMPTGLLVFTTGSSFLVSGGGGGAPLTPNNVSVLSQASPGANNLPPLPINGNVLYGQAKGTVIRDLQFNFYSQSYTGTDRSILASHLFSGFTLTEWCYAEAPFHLVPAVRNDGRMVVLTYLPEQEIYGWVPWETNGYYVSVSSIPEDGINAIYTIVQRFISGRWLYYIELFDNGLYDTVVESWCLDCALATPDTMPAANLTLSDITGDIAVTADSAVFAIGDIGKALWANTGWGIVTGYIGPTAITISAQLPFDVVPETTQPAPISAGSWLLNPQTTTVSGLDYLNGQLITAVADGVVVPAQPIVAGAITLPQPASRVVAGLSYTCSGQTLRLDLGDPTIQGKRRIIPRVTLRVNKSLGLNVGSGDSATYPVQELIPTFPPTLVSTDVIELIPSEWNKEGLVTFEQTAPYPATVLGIIPEVTVGDTMR